MCKFHACECVYAHKFNLKYKIYVRWNVIVFFWSYVELGMINFWNDKFYFISFFWRSFTLFSIMTCVDLKTESRRLQPNPAIKIISPTPTLGKAFESLHMWCSFFRKWKFRTKKNIELNIKLKVNLAIANSLGPLDLLLYIHNSV